MTVRQYDLSIFNTRIQTGNDTHVSRILKYLSLKSSANSAALKYWRQRKHVNHCLITLMEIIAGNEWTRH